jgi:hypothetical protein
MASCIQTLNGIALECNGSLGGVKEVYIAPYDAVASVTVGATNNATNQITGITMTDTKKFIGYKFRRNTANMTSTLNVDATNGTTVSTDLVLSFLRQDAVKRLEISALSIGETAVIVRDANDKYWYLGYDFPVMASAGTGETGTAFTDGNRYSITLQDNASDWPREIKVAAAETGDTDFVNLNEILAEPAV